MNVFIRIDLLLATRKIIGKLIVGTPLVAMLLLSGCGGYRAPTSGQMPGTTPKPYPAQRH